MSELKIQFHEERPVFKPGEKLKGRAGWKLDRPTRSLELRLIWFTLGNATQEAGIVRTIAFMQLLPEEMREFEFQLPEGPHSYIGINTVLRWGVELVALPSQENTLSVFDLSPALEPVVLHGNGPRYHP